MEDTITSSMTSCGQYVALVYSVNKILCLTVIRCKIKCIGGLTKSAPTLTLTFIRIVGAIMSRPNKPASNKKGPRHQQNVSDFNNLHIIPYNAMLSLLKTFQRLDILSYNEKHLPISQFLDWCDEHCNTPVVYCV
jgi:hypothetical protein